jgi:dipeptidyl aminopeptidase/acylaminoacyl peptidase
MKKLFPLLLLVVACISVAAVAQLLDPRFERATQAWDSGDYITALRGFEAILKGTDADRWFDRIALITGELYQVAQVAPDGSAVRFSPSGRYAIFETGTRPAIVTHIVDIERRLAKVAAIQGSSLVFPPAGETIAFLRVRESPEIVALLEEIEVLSKAAAPDRQTLTSKRNQLSALEVRNTDIILRDLASGSEQRLEDDGLLKAGIAFSADGREIYLAGGKESNTASNELYVVSTTGKPRALTSGPGFKTNPIVVPGGKFLIYAISAQSPFPRTGGGQPGQPGGRQGGAPGVGRQGGPPSGGAPGGGRGAGGQGARREFAVLELATGTSTNYVGSSPSISSDGSTLAFLSESGTETSIQTIKLVAPLAPAVIKKSQARIASLSVSPDGSRIAFEMPFQRNGEIFCISSDGTGEVRLTHEIQPDWGPRFFANAKVLAIKGERRHARSYVIDVDTQTGIKLFHNNTIRTIAPEYEWVANPAGNRILIVAQRDGDTISAARGVFVLDLNQKITREALLARIQENIASEQVLRAAGEAMFRPIGAMVGTVTERVSIAKIYEYEEALFHFDSKHISQPGNKRAGEYISRTFESFGYKPEYQWFNSGEIRTANVLATLRGTEDPELVYVLSSHYDSNRQGSGADDNSSATAVLLETARVMVKIPMPATIIFAAFTGEEAGLLGSREFVRQAVEKKMQLLGALNNDMIGWTGDHRLDNTIRYSNSGIRDLQHAASFLFSKMITYDARYFKSTDAAAYYDAYGDIVGGFGSYPVLGNPNYHQATDLLETVNHQLLAEAAKANTASIMLLAASPARVKNLKVEAVNGDAVELTWAPNPEKGVKAYAVAYGPEKDPMARTMTAKTPKARISGFKKGETLQVAVKAVNARGLSSWDWAHISIR